MKKKGKKPDLVIRILEELRDLEVMEALELEQILYFAVQKGKPTYAERRTD